MKMSEEIADQLKDWPSFILRYVKSPTALLSQFMSENFKCSDADRLLIEPTMLDTIKSLGIWAYSNPDTHMIFFWCDPQRVDLADIMFVIAHEVGYTVCRQENLRTRSDVFGYIVWETYRVVSEYWFALFKGKMS